MNYTQTRIAIIALLGALIIGCVFLYFTFLSRNELPENPEPFPFENGNYTMNVVLQFSDGSRHTQEDTITVTNDHDHITILNPEFVDYRLLGEINNALFRGNLDDAGAHIQFRGQITAPNTLEGKLTGQLKNNENTFEGTFKIISLPK